MGRESKDCGYLCIRCWLVSRVLDSTMTGLPTVFEIDWIHCDGTRIYATIKIDHYYNRKEEVELVFDSFCEALGSLLIQQDCDSKGNVQTT